MSSHTGLLVHCEVSGGKLSAITPELLGVGSRLAIELGQVLSAVLIGNDISSLAPEIISLGAQRVYVVDDSYFQDYAIEPYLTVMETVTRQVQPSIILIGQTPIGRDLAPRLAFRLNTVATIDCINLEIDAVSKRLLMTRPVYGGNAHAVQTCIKDPQIVAVRNKAMAPATKDDTLSGEVIRIESATDTSVSKMKVVDRKTESVRGIKLEDARVIVAGGRGIGSSDGFRQLENIAELLHGAVGATRPPCDAQWVPNSQQIGITGKVVSPDLYLAVALSGASQHLAGFFGSKVVVAINKDADANIFKVADYGIVADWKAVLPVLAVKLAEII
jgi:electron transfer flavoprotein alpha subunit